jgi:hypothetical protein
MAFLRLTPTEDIRRLIYISMVRETDQGVLDK